MVLSLVFVTLLSCATSQAGEMCPPTLTICGNVQGSMCWCNDAGALCANEGEICAKSVLARVLKENELGDNKKHCVAKSTESAKRCTKEQVCRPDDDEVCAPVCQPNSACGDTQCRCGKSWCASRDACVPQSGSSEPVVVQNMFLQEGEVATTDKPHCADDRTKQFTKCKEGDVCNPKAEQFGLLCVPVSDACTMGLMCTAAKACKCGETVCSHPEQMCDTEIVEIHGKILAANELATPTKMFCENGRRITKCDAGLVCREDGSCSGPLDDCVLDTTCASACKCGAKACSRSDQFCAKDTTENGSLVELTAENTLDRGYAADSTRKYCVQGVSERKLVATCAPKFRCHPDGHSTSTEDLCIADHAAVGHGMVVAPGNICIGDGMTQNAKVCEASDDRGNSATKFWCDLYNDEVCATKDPIACEGKPTMTEEECKAKTACFWEDACKKQTCKNARSTLESCSEEKQYVTDIALLMKACTKKQEDVPCSVIFCCVQKNEMTTSPPSVGTSPPSVGSPTTPTPGTNWTSLEISAIAGICIFLVLFVCFVGVFAHKMIFPGGKDLYRRGENTDGAERVAGVHPGTVPKTMPDVRSARVRADRGARTTPRVRKKTTGVASEPARMELNCRAHRDKMPASRSRGRSRQASEPSRMELSCRAHRGKMPKKGADAAGKRLSKRTGSIKKRSRR